MIISINLAIILLLLLITFQDFRYRAVSVWIFPILAGLILFAGFRQIPAVLYTKYLLLNLAFLFLQLGLLYVYLAIRFKTWANPLKGRLGLGDVLFFGIFALAFSPVRFIFFFLAGLIWVLLVYGLYLGIFKPRNKKVPLAGLLALFLAIVWAGQYVMGYLLLDDDPVMEWIGRW